MKTKLLFALCLMAGLGLAGVASAATANQIQPAMDVIYDDDLIVNGTGIFDSIRIGKQDSGGVTFFNGTIVNETTGEAGVNNPVTFGDNVRIDGTISRGETEGPGDNYPIKINDDVKIYGNIEWDKKKSVIAVAPFSCMSEQYTSDDKISVHDGGIFPGGANDFYYCLISPLTTYMKSATYDDNFKGHNKKFEIHLVPKALWLRCELVTCIDTDTYFHDLNWIGIEGAGFVAAYPDEDETIQLLISDYTREKTIEEMEKLGFVYKPELTEICENEYK